MKRFYTLSLTAALIAASCQTEDKQCLEKLQQELSQWEQQSVPTVPQGEITAPSDPSFVFQFDKQRYGVDAAGSVDIAYTLSEAAEVTVQVRDGWSTTVSGSGTASGIITVTAPDPAMATDLIVTATAANGRQTAAILPVMVRDPYTDATRTDIPAMGYFCFSTALATDYHFQKMAECGMNMLTVEWTDNWKEQLDLAQKYGLKVVLFVNVPGGIYYEDRNSTLLEETINYAKNHPALAAYQIFDEPHLMYLDQLKTVKRKIEELDPNPEHPVYLNIGPCNASEASYGVKEYEDYVEILISQCDLKFISFDQYPVYVGEVIPSWIKTLDIIYNACKRHNIPFWAFTLSCREWYREDPTLENIRLQCNTNLVYGAQVNQFFVYRATSGTNLAPLMGDGTYTVAYDYCQAYCREMHNFGFVFACSDVTKIRRSQFVDDFNLHISASDLPPQINTIHTTQDAFISFVENNGNKYLVVLNNLWNKAQEMQIELNDMVYMIDHDGKFTELQPGLYEFPLEGGDMLIFKYE